MATKTKLGGRLAGADPKGIKGMLVGLLGAAAVAAWTRLMENPELLKQVVDQLTPLFRHRGSSAKDIRETLRVLREQVDYLQSSADDEAEAERAQGWRRQLEQADRASQVVMAPGASSKQRRELRKRIDRLRTQIVEAFLEEKQEDLDDAKV